MGAMEPRTLDVRGTHYDMGRAHGAAFAAAIAAYAAERVALAADAGWTGRSLSRADVLALARDCLAEHEAFAPHLVDEMRGIADGAGTSVEEVVIAGGFTDFIDAVAAVGHGAVVRRGPLAAVDDCTAFLVPGDRMVDGHAVLGQTWDMHEGSEEHVVLLSGRPAEAPAFTVFTTAGCLGMIGMNEAGLSVGINNLMARDGAVGVTWPLVVRAMLERETTADALAVLARAPLAGGHNYLVLDASGAGANVEAMVSRTHVDELAGDPIVHTNHCLEAATRAVERERAPASQASSEARLHDARRLLTDAGRGGLETDDVMSVTADTASICYRGVAPLYVATCGAVIMRPATRELWAVAGRPGEQPYMRVSVPPEP